MECLFISTMRAVFAGWQDGTMTSTAFDSTALAVDAAASDAVDAPATVSSPAVALTIAGSEANGAAGAQADLKTFQELGVFGIANLTCIVSFVPKENGNHRFVPVDQKVIADQLEATTAAYGAASGAPAVLDTVKIGMLGSPATISTVAAALAAG